MGRKVNALGKDVALGPDEQISNFLYAYDFVLLDLSGANWCQEWGLKVNPQESEIFHFRNLSAPKVPFQFTCVM